MVALLCRFPSLRLLARAITFGVIAFALVTAATAIASDVTRISGTAAAALLTAFTLLIAATVVAVQWVFRNVP
jgi:hypothetical protein